MQSSGIFQKAVEYGNTAVVGHEFTWEEYINSFDVFLEDESIIILRHRSTEVKLFDDDQMSIIADLPPVLNLCLVYLDFNENPITFKKVYKIGFCIGFLKQASIELMYNPSSTRDTWDWI